VLFGADDKGAEIHQPTTWFTTHPAVW
jgi:hypothetical protein